MHRPSKSHHTDAALRGAIIGQYLSGSSMGEVQRTLDVSKTTVYKWIKRYNDEGSIERRAQPGRVKALSQTDRADVLQKIIDRRFLNASQVSREYKVDPKTIQKIWDEAGIHCYRAAKKPVLTKNHKEQRVGFALENINRDWNRVIFSDEKTFLSDRLQMVRVYRPQNTRYEEHYLHRIQRSGRITAGIWGWISYAGPGEMCFVGRHFDRFKYKEILEEILLPSVDISFGGFHNMVFMQDNCSIHNSILIREWFKNDHPEIEVLNWPPNSADLNPIENFWAETTRYCTSIFPRNRSTLDPYIVRNWEEMRPRTQYFENLYASMPNRLREVLDNNGGPTSY